MKAVKMRYVLLMYGDEARGETPTEMTPELAAQWDEFWRVQEQTESLVRSWGALTPTTTATTLRVGSNGALTTDGPFAETKEQLGGYIVIECAGLDEAIAFAARVPCAPHGSIEVRAISSEG